MAYPNHFELRFLGLSGPNWSLSMLIFQHPSIISTQIDFQNFKIFVLSYSDLIDIHGWSELLNNEGTTQFWMEQAFWTIKGPSNFWMEQVWFLWVGLTKWSLFFSATILFLYMTAKHDPRAQRSNQRLGTTKYMRDRSIFSSKFLMHNNFYFRVL